MEWVAISSSRESSQPRDQTCISGIGRRILYHRATREPEVTGVDLNPTGLGVLVREEVRTQTRAEGDHMKPRGEGGITYQ